MDSQPKPAVTTLPPSKIVLQGTTNKVQTTAPLAVPGRPGTVAVATRDDPVSVQVCGRLVTVPADATGSLAIMSRHLATQLKISGHSCLQFADVAGRAIRSDQELTAALANNRQPLQASMTVSALREIEQKKSEVETKKEELAQFQWQVVVDQIAALSQQVTAVAASLQGVKDDCQQSIQKCREEEQLKTERMEEAVLRETQQREMSHKDMEAKIDKLVQAICAERSARDVASHQLSSQMDAAVASLEADRNLRAQERAEVERLYQGMKHQVDAECARNEEQWNWHLETAKRLDARLEDRHTADLSNSVRLQEMEASCERLRATVTSVESALSTAQRSMQELMSRRGEELQKAVRDEMLGRENHIARFAKELETSWQSLEARLQRGREESATATATVAERLRVVESRCHEIENDLSNHIRVHTDQHQNLSQRMHSACTMVDTMEMALKSSDVVTQTTVSRLEEAMERLVNVEEDCKLKVRADYWQPQMEALVRADKKFEDRLILFEQELNSRLSQEASQRDGLKTQLQDSMKSCMDKIGSAKPATSGRFIEVNQSAGSPQSVDDGLVTPRCGFGVAGSPQGSAHVPASMITTQGPFAVSHPGSAATCRAPSTPLHDKVVRQVSYGGPGGAHSPRHPRPVLVAQGRPSTMVGSSSVTNSVGSASPQAPLPPQAMLRMFSPRTS